MCKFRFGFGMVQTIMMISLLMLCCQYECKADHGTKAKIISCADERADVPNTWIAFRKDVKLRNKPQKAVLEIAADSKYWLYVNGEMVVFEGGLKRGPAPGEGYYDEVDISGYLKKGENKIAVLLWYFGKSGFSHLSSGKSALAIGSDIAAFRTDHSWLSAIHPSYGTASGHAPNYRLSESNILFDARKDIPEWITGNTGWMSLSAEIGEWGDKPLGALSPRPIPQWKDFGIKELEFEVLHLESGIDSVIARLPYNMQMTPIISVNDPEGGNVISISTDHTISGGDYSIHAQYITKAGHQTYESYGWMNGEKLLLLVPSGVSLEKIAYRETGFDTTPEGTFKSTDPFVDRFWQKSLRTLYVNMRDTFFDCPDRERAQWWGDATVLMGESFYAYSTSVHSLMKKGILELCSHSSEDGVLHSPIPGIWNQELPGQMLASIGEYGFWRYYLNTGDLETLRTVYPYVKRYLSLWEVDETGLTKYRVGGWNWGDWGEEKDVRLLHAGWHSLALQGARKMALALGYGEDAANYAMLADGIKKGFNGLWNGYAYRDPEYHGRTDDRAQALAVLAGIADPDKYDAIISVLKSQMHASPYMEKYVIESLFVMGEEEYAMERFKQRYSEMVLSEEHSTLYEGWDVGSADFGGGTTNHAWSGGPLTVFAEYLCGLAPIEPGWKRFSVKPCPEILAGVSFSFPTVSGTIGLSWKEEENGKRVYHLTVPEGSVAEVYIGGKRYTLEGGEHALTE